jgi:hypothetical protein
VLFSDFLPSARRYGRLKPASRLAFVSVSAKAMHCSGFQLPRPAAELKKGDRCYVEGTIELDTWRGSDGADRRGLAVTSFKIEKTHLIGRNRPPKRDQGSTIIWPRVRRAGAILQNPAGLRCARSWICLRLRHACRRLSAQGSSSTGRPIASVPAVTMSRPSAAVVHTAAGCRSRRSSSFRRFVRASAGPRSSPYEPHQAPRAAWRRRRGAEPQRHRG